MNIQTRLIKLSDGTADPSVLEEIAAVLRADGVMVFPTDTFYGLGGNALSAGAVEKIYGLKGRDRGKPLSVVVADVDQARDFTRDRPAAWSVLARAFWPGPLTVVLPAGPGFPAAMLGPGGSVALRVPALPWLCALLKKTGFPVTATSANLSGDGELDDPAAVRRVFDGRAELIVDGGRTPGGAPSTIVDLTAGVPRLVRPGAVAWESVLAVLAGRD
jgi:L-threonylcarbamoyladenylate synthase